FNIGPRDCIRWRCPPIRQDVTTDQGVGLLPGFVALLRVLQIVVVQFSKSASIPLRSFLSGRGFAFNDGEHQLGGNGPRLRERNRIGSTDVIPARPIAMAINQFETAVAARLYLQSQSALEAIPN